VQNRCGPCHRHRLAGPSGFAPMPVSPWPVLFTHLQRATLLRHDIRSNLTKICAPRPCKAHRGCDFLHFFFFPSRMAGCNETSFKEPAPGFGCVFDEFSPATRCWSSVPGGMSARPPPPSAWMRTFYSEEVAEVVVPIIGLPHPRGYLMARAVSTVVGRALASRGKTAPRFWPVDAPCGLSFRPDGPGGLWGKPGAKQAAGLTCCPTPPKGPLSPQCGAK